ncbi:hypothetical protein M422DRAFT_146395, partial [Sphaerobolus stellatus SS14]
EEIEIICGVYKIEVLGRSGQYTEASWWPKPNIWETCGLHTGYWNTDCESWYQSRIKRIEDQTASLRSSTEWK